MQLIATQLTELRHTQKGNARPVALRRLEIEGPTIIADVRAWSLEAENTDCVSPSVCARRCPVDHEASPPTVQASWPGGLGARSAGLLTFVRNVRRMVSGLNGSPRPCSYRVPMAVLSCTWYLGRGRPLPLHYWLDIIGAWLAMPPLFLFHLYLGANSKPGRNSLAGGPGVPVGYIEKPLMRRIRLAS